MKLNSDYVTKAFGMLEYDAIGLGEKDFMVLPFGQAYEFEGDDWATRRFTGPAHHAGAV